MSVSEAHAVLLKRKIEIVGVVPGPSSEVYAFYRGATQRNLYRIPIP